MLKWTVDPLPPKLLEVVKFGKHEGLKWSEVPKDYLDWLKNKRANDKEKKEDINLDFTIEHYLTK